MDAPSQQLQKELNESVTRALKLNRPVLTHINADSTWVLQLPYPSYASAPKGRSRLNILIDPWLQGSQSDIASWFSTQWHVIKPSVATIEELEERLADVEAAATKHSRRSSFKAQANTNWIDAVILSFEYTDHTHWETLRQLSPSTPIYARSRAAELVRSWKHFDIVYDIPSLHGRTLDWRRSSIGSLPAWLGVFELAPREDSVSLHCALVVTFDTETGTKTRHSKYPEGFAEAILYSPHGVLSTHVQPLLAAAPPINPLAILHGTDEIGALGQKIGLGARNGLLLQKMCNAKYFLPTHDEPKRARGIFSPFLRRKVWTVGQVASEEEKNEKSFRTAFVNVRCGESILLE